MLAPGRLSRPASVSGSEPYKLDHGRISQWLGEKKSKQPLVWASFPSVSLCLSEPLSGQPSERKFPCPSFPCLEAGNPGPYARLACALPLSHIPRPLSLLCLFSVPISVSISFPVSVISVSLTCTHYSLLLSLELSDCLSLSLLLSCISENFWVSGHPGWLRWLSYRACHRSKFMLTKLKQDNLVLGPTATSVFSAQYYDFLEVIFSHAEESERSFKRITQECFVL